MKHNAINNARGTYIQLTGSYYSFIFLIHHKIHMFKKFLLFFNMWSILERQKRPAPIQRNTTIKYSHMIKGDKRRDLELSRHIYVQQKRVSYKCFAMQLKAIYLSLQLFWRVVPSNQLVFCTTKWAYQFILMKKKKNRGYLE